MSAYLDTTLISANRKQSVEYLGGNVESSAVFTNKLGSGLKLNIGDRVSISNSFISEIGNEAATIEVKGSRFNVDYSSSQTIGGYEYNTTARTFESNTPLFSGSYTQTEVTNTITDNNINLTYSFYKNTNGEFYYHLPRLGIWNPTFCDWNASHSTKNIWCSRNASVNGSITHINPFMVTNDYRVKYLPMNYIEGGFLAKPYSSYPDDTKVPYTTSPVNDGGRYTIFVRKDFRATGYTNYLAGHRDPALLDYIWFKNTKKISVATGFNSPLNVADQFTNSLTQVERLSPLLIENTDITNGNPDKYNSAPARVNMEIESDTNKLFVVAAAVNTRHDYALEYHKRTNILYDIPADTDNLYEMGYATIGIKRPEIYEQGTFMDNYTTGTKQNSDDARKFITSSLDGSFTLGGVKVGADTEYFTSGLYFPLSNPLNEQYQNIIPTSLEWNDINLNRVNKFLLAQEKYKDEIIDERKFVKSQQTWYLTTDKVDPLTMRYCHLNCSATPGLDPKFGVKVTDVVCVSGTTTIDLTGKTISGTLKVGQLVTSSGGTNEGTNQFVPYNTYITKIDTSVYPAGILSLSAPFMKAATLVDLYFTDRKLGNDNYIDADYSIGTSAAAVFFDYNPDLKNNKEGIGDKYETLYQGFGVKVDNGVDPEGLIPRYTIGFRAEKYVLGLPGNFWTNTIGSKVDPSADARMINPCQTSMGFDRHFNAFGTCAMCLYNGEACLWDQYYRNTNASTNINESLSLAPSHFGVGYINTQEFQPRRDNGEGFQPEMVSSTTYSANLLENSLFKNTIYLGANDPLMTFSSGQSRFQITRLHTPEKVGNLANAESSNPGSNAIVYKINKRLNNDNWTREMSPYDQQDFFAEVGNGESGAGGKQVRAVSVLNDNLQPFSICDTMCGITIEDYGVTEELWNKSLWGLMGFTYSQFHNEETNRNQRIFDKGLTTSTPTTNAQVTSADALGFPRNAFGVPFIGSLSGNIARQVRMLPKTPSNYPVTSILGMFDRPTIVQNCSSVSITAQNLPKKMISPVYLIKSDLIDSGFIGGNESSTSLPVMSVVPKNSGYGDFYNGQSGETFTITHPRTITSIQTQICDADGSLSRVDDASLVVYKVEKEMAGNGNIIQEILNPSPPTKV
tara:strand:+ start:1289 stop:4690 length:3402 start_codon:yes stop_codon:yes gene_type:complete